MRLSVVLLGAALLFAVNPGQAQLRLADGSDRAAFREWFVLLADATFYRTPDEVRDCAALVRHAVREALRPHSPEWLRRAQLPLARIAPEIRSRPREKDGMLPLFRVSAAPGAPFAEFADARTIVRLNARLVGRDIRALAPGDLLYFRQGRRRMPDHLMIFVGRSWFEPTGDDWVVYHTGPSPSTDTRLAASSGEIRKVRLADLLKHPAARWRPVSENASFVGLFRLRLVE